MKCYIVYFSLNSILSLMVDFKKKYLYRMIHIENIPHVLQYGITHRNSIKANPNFVPIGDSSIISRRETKMLANGRLLGDYIPFYFGTRFPMLYVIQNGYNGVNRTIPEDIIYCVTSVQEILISEIDFLFSNGHAIDNLSSFYSKEDIKNINNIVDFDAVNKSWWIDENDLDIKRRKEAEFLLSEDLPINYILGYICYKEEVKSRLIDYGICNSKIVVRPNFYF